MIIIEAMRRIKLNDDKIKDLQRKIAANSANYDIQRTEYGLDARKKVAEWVQSCIDITQENVRLHTAIQRTNLATSVTITIGGKDVTKSIAEWVLRRRIYAKIDETTMAMLTNKGLRQEAYKRTENGQEINGWTVVELNYDPEQRDQKLAEYHSEPMLINSALEIVNATTTLIEA